MGTSPGRYIGTSSWRHVSLVLRTSVEDVLMTPVGDAPWHYIEHHMGMSIGRLLGTSSGRNFAEWVEVSFMFNVSLYTIKIINVKKKTIDL